MTMVYWMLNSIGCASCLSELCLQSDICCLSFLRELTRTTNAYVKRGSESRFRIIDCKADNVFYLICWTAKYVTVPGAWVLFMLLLARTKGLAQSRVVPESFYSKLLI